MSPVKKACASASPAAMERSVARMAAGVTAGSAAMARSASTAAVSRVRAPRSSAATTAVASCVASVRIPRSPTATRTSVRMSARPTALASCAVMMAAEGSVVSAPTPRTSASMESVCVSPTVKVRPVGRTAAGAPVASAAATPTASRASAPRATASERSAVMMAAGPHVARVQTRCPGATTGAAMRPASRTVKTRLAARMAAGAPVALVTIPNRPASRVTASARRTAWDRTAVMMVVATSAETVRRAPCVMMISACRARARVRSVERTPAVSRVVSAAATPRSASRGCAAINASRIARSAPAAPMVVEARAATVPRTPMSALRGSACARPIAMARPAVPMAAGESAGCVRWATAWAEAARTALAATPSVGSTPVGRAAARARPVRSAPRALASRSRSRRPIAKVPARGRAWTRCCAPWRSAIQTAS